jgi:uncharacterized membrane protein (UPF0127 family)
MNQQQENNALFLHVFVCFPLSKINDLCFVREKRRTRRATTAIAAKRSVRRVHAYVPSSKTNKKKKKARLAIELDGDLWHTLNEGGGDSKQLQAIHKLASYHMKYPALLAITGIPVNRELVKSSTCTMFITYFVGLYKVISIG